MSTLKQKKTYFRIPFFVLYMIMNVWQMYVVMLSVVEACPVGGPACRQAGLVDGIRNKKGGNNVLCICDK